MTEDKKKQLIEEIQIQRFKKKKSQEECAKALNISIPTYRELEYHPEKIELDQAFILSEFLDFNIFDIFFN